VRKPPIYVDIPYYTLLERIQPLNAKLFDKLGICITAIEPSAENIVYSIISKCGAVNYEVPRSFLNYAQWDERVLELIQNDQELLRWIGDVSFGKFTKSELYLTLCSRIVLPTQMASGIQFNRNTKSEYGLGADSPSFIITGIEHDNSDPSAPQLLTLTGGLPAIDGFEMGQETFPLFARAAGVTLDLFLAEFIPIFLTFFLTEDHLTVSDNRWGQLFNPRTPAELWIMHRTMGTIGGGVLVCAGHQ
jgi:hypothetical protein